MLNIQSGQGKITDLQRIAVILGIKEGSDNLCLLIQDKINSMKENIKAKESQIKRLRMTNETLSYKYNKMELEKQNKANRGNIDDSVTNTYKKENIRLRKNNEELNQSIYGLQQELKKYKQEKINKIVYSKDIRDLEFKEYLL